jgi:hypothetical protein
MTATKQRINKLKELLRLEEEKRKAAAALAAIDLRIAALQRIILGGAPAPTVPGVARRGRRPGRPRLAKGAAPAVAQEKKPGRKRGKRVKSSAKRGEVSEKILAALKGAGPAGMSIKELEAQTGIKYAHLSVWFSTTGKKNKSVERMTPGRYRFR